MRKLDEGGESVTHSARAASAISAALAVFWSAASQAEYGLNMTEGVTRVSREVYELHMLIFWICVVIGVFVFGAMFYSMYHHRKDKGAVPAQFHESTTVEVLWTIIPMLILIGMAIPATRVLIALEDASEPDLTVTVTGYQWKWKYEYLDEGVSFFSTLATPREQIAGLEEKGEHYLLEVDNPLVLPVGKKVRILTTAADVIHAWWVPDLGWKRDAIPGYINESWTFIEKPGVFRGQCAELCGKDHDFMPVVVDARPEEEFNLWLAGLKGQQLAVAGADDREWTQTELMEQGEQIYNTMCSACHQANGEGLPGAFPGLKGSAIVTGPVEDHIDLILNGKAGTAMAAFGPQLSDADVAAVVTYERNAWGNATGDVIQPAKIATLR